jgi:F420-non-reducing hydrogenase iron-sulfur subunit
VSTNEAFTPTLLGFLCNWCSYAGADLAGVSRFQYPPNLRVIRVMCSGRVDPIHVLEAFTQQIDGVMVLGCHPGDCHYLTGNIFTESRMKTLQEFLDILGLNPERLCLNWVSASEGERFAQLVTEFTLTIQNLGPITSDLPAHEIFRNLEAAKVAFSQQKPRWLMNKEPDLLTQGNVFGEFLEETPYKKLKLATLIREYEKNKLLLSLNDQSLSIQAISQSTGLQPQQILRYLIALEHEGAVTVSDRDGATLRYQRRRGDES